MNIDSNKKVVLFDGVCNLCNSSVQFMLKHDKKNQFVFGSLQGRAGQAYLRQFHLSSLAFNSFILVENGKAYTHSTGALRMMKHIGGGWSLLYAFIIVPPFIRNAAYNLIAKNRYKWFGRQDACRLPTYGLEARFLDEAVNGW